VFVTTLTLRFAAEERADEGSQRSTAPKAGRHPPYAKLTWWSGGGREARPGRPAKERRSCSGDLRQTGEIQVHSSRLACQEADRTDTAGCTPARRSSPTLPGKRLREPMSSMPDDSPVTMPTPIDQVQHDEAVKGTTARRARKCDATVSPTGSFCSNCVPWNKSAAEQRHRGSRGGARQGGAAWQARDQSAIQCADAWGKEHARCARSVGGSAVRPVRAGRHWVWSGAEPGLPTCSANANGRVSGRDGQLLRSSLRHMLGPWRGSRCSIGKPFPLPRSRGSVETPAWRG
jgi:hypothetical protein